MSYTDDSIQQRLKEVFEALDLTIYQVSKELNENPSKFYNILSGRAKPSYDTIMSLLAQYPQIRADFLLRGVRPVLSAEVPMPVVKEDNSRIIPINRDEMIELPFVPVKFYASFIESFNEGLKESDLNTYRLHESLVNSSKFCVVIEISGSSMSPQLVSGAKVLAEQVDQSDWEYLSGGVFAVMYRDYFVVKRIKENTLLTKKQLTLHSDNPLGGNVTVNLSDILGIWRVISIVESPVE